MRHLPGADPAIPVAHHGVFADVRLDGVFLAELDYAGLFAIQNVDMEQIQPLMMIECPRLLFPYARKILADLTQDGGHLPIMLDMPDFTSMFREEMMRRAQEQGLN